MDSMNVFLAGIIQGSLAEAAIHEQDWRGPIKQAIARRLPQAQVYCHYSAHPDSIAYDLTALRKTLADGIRRAADCDLLVAFVPSASMGTAIEMYEAARRGAVVLTITPLKVNWVVRAYSDRIFDNVQELESFLGSPEFADLMASKRASGFGDRVSAIDPPNPEPVTRIPYPTSESRHPMSNP
jgi:hypothetical protein